MTTSRITDERLQELRDDYGSRAFSANAFAIDLALDELIERRTAISGFCKESLTAVADGLDCYEKTVNVGQVFEGGDMHLESTTAYAARFIRTMLALAPGLEQDISDAADELSAAPGAEAAAPMYTCANAFSQNAGKCQSWCGSDRMCPECPTARIESSGVRAAAPAVVPREQPPCEQQSALSVAGEPQAQPEAPAVPAGWLNKAMRIAELAAANYGDRLFKGDPFAELREYLTDAPTAPAVAVPPHLPIGDLLRMYDEESGDWCRIARATEAAVRKQFIGGEG